MLYRRLVARLTRLNGRHFDPAIVDTSLEYYEALRDIRRHHPEVKAEDDKGP